ncbi:MAG: NB-ARC domain protein [Candidatus Methanolliviera sp. GoM_asphalt]|nr:MAG: NB-ARC domain protein [Candidatus Methanolliviera sp. GoM_asphalt]
MSGEDVLSQSLLNDLLICLDDNQNAYISGRAGTGKTTILINLLDYLERERPEWHIVYTPKLTPPKQALISIYSQLTKQEKDESEIRKMGQDQLTDEIYKIITSGERVIFLADNTNKTTPSMFEFLNNVLDLSLKTDNVNVIGAGRFLPKDERARFYFTIRIIVQPLDNAQADRMLKEAHPDLDHHQRKEIIQKSFGSPIALQQYAKLMKKKGKIKEGMIMAEASQQFVMELLPVAILFVLSYVVIALRFFIYWEVQIALLFVAFYAVRGMVIQVTKYLEWHDQAGY